MEYIVSASTDVGIKKSTNQDSLTVKVAKTDVGNIVMAFTENHWEKLLK